MFRDHFLVAHNVKGVGSNMLANSNVFILVAIGGFEFPDHETPLWNQP